MALLCFCSTNFTTRVIYYIFQEILRESQIALLQLHYKRVQNETLLKTELNDMLNLYPNNFFALSVFASIEVNIKLIICC